MIQIQLKLILNQQQEKIFADWLGIIFRVWNWAIRKIELDGKDGVYYSKLQFQNLLAGHCKILGIPSMCIQGVLVMAHETWSRCYKKIGKAPRLKGKKNPMTSIPFPAPIKGYDLNRIRLPIIGLLRFHKQDIPEGKIKQARVVKKASGWYLCLFIDAEPKKIDVVSEGKVGIDPGFKSTLTLSTGEKIERPKRGKELEKRLAQAQRGINRKLVARLHESIKNRRKEDSHAISTQLVKRFDTIFVSKDSIKGIAKIYGKSVAEAGHYQIKKMVEYKAKSVNRKFLEVDNKNSTKNCSCCKKPTGPSGKRQLKIRIWTCENCGQEHDRDVNAATNTLIAGMEILNA